MVGDRVSFLRDDWWESGLVFHQFSNIYAVALDRDAMAKDYMIGQGGNKDWWIGLMQNLNDWDLRVYEHVGDIIIFQEG